MSRETNEENVIDLFNYYIIKNNMFLITKEQHDKYISLTNENDRLNNIINELEDMIVVKLQRDYHEHDYRITTEDLEEIYDRLKELKEKE